jgi:hypothetical protein
MQADEKPSRVLEERPAPPPRQQSTAPAPSPAADESTLDAEILQSAEELGYDAAKVRKWINQKYSVTGGLESLTAQDKRDVLKIFREKGQTATAKTARR